MTQLLKRVQPGDVITAEMWNLAVDAVNELLLGSQASGIQITALLPAGTADDPIRIGTQQQISGQSFGYSIGQSTVTFQGPSGPVVVTRNNMLVGSSDTRLLFTVPPIPDLPQIGAILNMRVDNGVAHDIRTVFVKPVVATVSGDVFVNWRADATPNPDPNPIQPPGQARFFYQVQTGINIPATFTLSANITSATTPISPQLVSSIEFQNESGSLIPNKQLEMGRNETRNIIVRIPNIPTALANQTFTLEIRAASANIQGSDARLFTVGTPVTPADPNIVSEQTGFEVFNASTEESDNAGGSLAGSTINLRANRLAILAFNVRLLAAGSYDLTIQPPTGATLNGWTLAVLNPPSPISVTGNNSQQIYNVNFAVTRTPVANAGGTFVVRIQKQGEARDWHKQFQLELMS